MPKTETKAVVVLSGGQDSATCLALAVKKYGVENVSAITFRYGQRHNLEVVFAKRIAKHFGIKRHKVISFDFYKHLTTNALMDKSAKIEKKKGASCPTSVVEGRNSFFLLAAAVWAKSIGATVLYTGVSETDYSGYPDCRAAFIRSQEKTIRLALEWPVKIVTPFIRMTKDEEWAIADKLGIFVLILNDTLTCYNGIPGSGCGECPACKLRDKGLKKYMKSKHVKKTGKNPRS
jgi:7-cyano-7-deazaguanine synthase